MTKIIMYGAMWCHDTLRTKKILDDHNIDYTLYDVEDTNQGEIYSQTVMDMNNGKRIVPTLLINEVQYTNPSPQELGSVLQINSAEIHSEQIPDVCIPNYQ